MKKLKFLIVATLLITTLGACRTNTQRHLIQSTLWIQNASEYRALTFQAYTLARKSLEIELQQGDYTKPPCIVLDLDETCLDNSPYTGYQIQHGKPYNKADWKRWTSQQEADSIPGSVSFLRWADAQGVAIFYVSNRNVSELGATLANMQRLGFPQATRKQVRLRDSTSNKEPRRLEIEQTHTIAMLLGDNLNDFSEDFEHKTTLERAQLTNENRHKFGTKYIIFPNPNYGSWESALYNYKRFKNAREAEKSRLKKVKSFE